MFLILFTIRKSRHPIFGGYPPLAECQGIEVVFYRLAVGRHGLGDILGFRSIGVILKGNHDKI